MANRHRQRAVARRWPSRSGCTWAQWVQGTIVGMQPGYSHSPETASAALGSAGASLPQHQRLRLLQATRHGSRSRLISAALAATLATTFAGCASRSIEVKPQPTDPARYAIWSCDRLFDETDAVQQQAADVAYAVDSRAGANIIALGLGVTVFWPALLAMRPDGPEAAQLAELKGRFEALHLAAARQACGAAPETMASQRQASLSVALGDTLVYDLHAGVRGTVPQTLALKVSALRRDQLEFSVALDGQALAAPLRQDLAGNVALDGRLPLMSWRRLLKPDLALGQVLAGDLALAGETVPSARLRGQVVAIGPQTVAGRGFDVAVIELFGEAPMFGQFSSSSPSDASTPLEGVIAVDRRSGVLLRLELRCANPDYSLRRRLLRVEPATH